MDYLIKSPAKIVKSTYNEHGGHPLILNSSVIDPILAYDGPDGLRGAIKASKGQNETIEVQDSANIIPLESSGKVLAIASSTSFPILCTTNFIYYWFSFSRSKIVIGSFWNKGLKRGVVPILNCRSNN